MKPTRIFDLIDRNCELIPDANALSAKSEGKWITYNFRQYAEYARLFALGLIELGISKGDKIATITNNRPEWNFADMGMSMAGVIHVPMYTSLNSAEYRYILEHSDARIVILSDNKLYETIKPVCDKVKNIKFVYTFSKTEHSKHWMEIVETGKNVQCQLKENWNN